MNPGMNQCNMHPIASIVHSDPDAELRERPYTWQRNVFCEMIWARCDKHLLENSSWIVQSHVQGMRPSSWCRTGGLARRSSPSWEAGCGHVNLTCKGRKAAQTSQATFDQCAVATLGPSALRIFATPRRVPFVVLLRNQKQPAVG